MHSLLAIFHGHVFVYADMFAELAFKKSKGDGESDMDLFQKSYNREKTENKV